MMKYWSMDLQVNRHSVICFDLDDTLYNEIDFLKSAYVEIAKKLAVDDWLSLYAKMLSLYRKGQNVFQYLVSSFNCNMAELVHIYREHYPNIEPFHGVLDLLNTIADTHGKLCVITDGRSRTQRNKLQALGIIDFFDKVIISEEIGTEKPTENNFLKIEEAFPDSSYTYIGDNLKKDFITPNARNWNSIGLVDNGLNIHNNTADYFKEKNSPRNLVYHITDIKIV